jgi:hypothetical protein
MSGVLSGLDTTVRIGAYTVDNSISGSGTSGVTTAAHAPSSAPVPGQRTTPAPGGGTAPRAGRTWVRIRLLVNRTGGSPVAVEELVHGRAGAGAAVLVDLGEQPHADALGIPPGADGLLEVVLAAGEGIDSGVGPDAEGPARQLLDPSAAGASWGHRPGR